MPLIQPISAPVPARVIQRSDAQNNPYSALQTPGQSTQNAQSNETAEKAIEPAAPPSALQMQIKALISEQAKSLADPSGADRAEPS